VFEGLGALSCRPGRTKRTIGTNKVRDKTQRICTKEYTKVEGLAVENATGAQPSTVAKGGVLSQAGAKKICNAGTAGAGTKRMSGGVSAAAAVAEFQPDLCFLDRDGAGSGQAGVPGFGCFRRV